MRALPLTVFVVIVVYVSSQSTVSTDNQSSTAPSSLHSNGSSETPSPSPNDVLLPSFVRDLSSNLKKEFLDIVTNPDMTAAEIDQKIINWGRSNGLEDKVKSFEDDSRRTQKEQLSTIGDAVNQLPEAFARVRAIVSAENLSGRAIQEQLTLVISSYPNEVQNLLRHVLKPQVHLATTVSPHPASSSSSISSSSSLPNSLSPIPVTPLPQSTPFPHETNINDMSVISNMTDSTNSTLA